MVTLVGEPGIGKTRTAEELATYARMRGAEVLWGRSYESVRRRKTRTFLQAKAGNQASLPPLIELSLAGVQPLVVF